MVYGMQKKKYAEKSAKNGHSSPQSALQIKK